MKIQQFDIELAIPVDGVGYFFVDMPKGGRIIKIVSTTDGPLLLAEVDPEAPVRRYSFASLWTDRGDIPDGYRYLDSIWDPNHLVWHVYKKEEGPDGEEVGEDPLEGFTVRELVAMYDGLGEDKGLGFEEALKCALRGDLSWQKHPMILAAKMDGKRFVEVPARVGGAEPRYKMVDL